MKKFIPLILFLLTSVAIPEVSAQFREFKSKDGTSIQARLIAKNEEGVTIEMKDGKRFTVKLERFSEQDQDFIQKWSAPIFEYSISKSDYHSRISSGAFTKEALKGYEVRVWRMRGTGSLIINPSYLDEFIQSLRECRLAYDRIANSYIPNDFEAVVKTRSQRAEFKISFESEWNGQAQNRIGVISFETIYPRSRANADGRLTLCYGKIRERDIEYLIDYLMELDVEGKVRIIREAENKVSR